MTHAVSRLALHAVARLRATRLARSLKPFIARGSRKERCPGCRVMHSHCLCALRPSWNTVINLPILCTITWAWRPKR